jgi:RNA polymerase sigma-70 factor (ECF subfamily)
LVLLADQDRALWNREQIAEGRATLDRAVALRGRGQYVLQAAIASLQSADQIDWAEVASLYARLAEVTGSPVVQLNRAVAIAEAGSPGDALALVDTLDLADYQYLHATRAELLKRLGREAEARVALQRAIELARSDAERRLLERRAAEWGRED